MLRSAEMYLSGVENAVMRENMNSGGNFRPNLCTISSEGNLDCEGKDGIIEVEVNGEKPKNGNIVFENGKIKEVTLTYESGTIVKDTNGNLVYEGSDSNITYESLGNYQHQASDGTVEAHDTESGTCSKCGETVLAPGLYKEDGTFVSWEQLTSTDYQSITYETLTYNDEGEPTEEVTRGILYIYGNNPYIEEGSLESGYNDALSDRNLSNEYLNGKLVLSSDVTNILSQAFSLCDNLKEIIMPNSVKNIELFAFLECYNLTTVTFTNELTYIGEAAFYNNLTTINYIGTMEEWNTNSSNFDSYWNIYCPEITVHCTDGNIVIPANN